MLLKSARFRCFGPFQDRVFEFQPGLIGISGPNGSGKSTLVNGIYAALTGDFKRFHGVKADNIYDGARPREPSFIEVTASHNGVEFVITRKMRGTDQNELVVRGAGDEGRDLVITNANDVEAEFERRLGVDRRLIDKYVFVKQLEMGAIFDMTPQKRSEAFQRLCRLDGAKSIYEAVGAFMDSHVPTEVVDNSAWIITRLGEISLELEGHEATIAELVSRQLNEASLRSAQALLQKDQTRATKQTELDTKLTALAQHQQTATATRSRCARGSQSLLAKESQVKELRPFAAEQSQLQERWQAYEAQQERLTELRQQIEQDQRHVRTVTERLQAATQRLSKATGMIVDKASGESVKEAVPRVTRELEKLRTEVTIRQEVVDLADAGTSVCSTCHQPVSDQFVQCYREALPGLIQQRDAKNKLLNEVHDAKQAYVVAKQASDGLNTYQARLRTNGERLLQLEASPLEAPSQALDDSRDYAAELLAAESAFNQLRKDLTEWERAATAARTRVDVLQTDVTKLQEDIIQNTVAEETLARVRTRMDEHDLVGTLILQKQGQVQELTKQQQDLNEQLQVLRDYKAKSAKMDEARAILSQVRETFHWSGLPQTVSQLNLDKMQDSVNAALELFGSPFSVTTGDALTFNVAKPGHAAHRAERASVGQMGVLSIAMRLTVNQVFGTDLGLMVLDEPTEGLDNQNLQLFQDALAQLAANVQGERQVILISHVPGLTDSCDQVIELEAT